MRTDLNRQLARLARDARCLEALDAAAHPVWPDLEVLRAAAKAEADKARSQLRAKNQEFFRKLDNQNL